jgi:hypothetical protein
MSANGQRKTSRVGLPTRPRLENRCWVVGDVLYVDVSTTKHPRAIAVLDACDIALVLDGGGRWHAHQATRGGLYVWRSAHGATRSIRRLHRQIMGIPEGTRQLVDHRDGDGLNNARSNLRIASRAQNNMNRGPRAGSSSRFKGVFFHKASCKWMAEIRCDGRADYLGLFGSEEAAARAYDTAAVRLHGDFARLNFPEAA